MKVHPSHDTRISDASSFDEICKRCGATDSIGGTLDRPCPQSPSDPVERLQQAAPDLYRAIKGLLAANGGEVGVNGYALRWTNIAEGQAAVQAARDALARCGEQP